MKHSLSAFAVLAAALLCIVAFARFCPPQHPDKGLRRIDLGAWAPRTDTLALPPIPPPEPIPEPAGPDTSTRFDGGGAALPAVAVRDGERAFDGVCDLVQLFVEVLGAVRYA